jgi:DNA-binding ferritin-like protein|tara:strand:+ start:147 stop:665 length:519 start_codon:yes stop_codon:yes gene_type:complete
MHNADMPATSLEGVMVVPHEKAMVPCSSLVQDLVRLASFLKEMQTQSHLIHLNYEGSNFIAVHGFLKERYEAHQEQFDTIAEFVRAMDFYMPMCACGLRDEMPSCFNNVTSHDGRDMLMTYHANLCDLCEMICELEPAAIEMKAMDVANYLAELMADANKTTWYLKATLRCG